MMGPLLHRSSTPDHARRILKELALSVFSARGGNIAITGGFNIARGAVPA